MAIDNTPPRLRLIVTIALIVVITLVGLDFVFKSYYAYMSDGAQHEKLAPTKAKTEQGIAEKASFAAAKIPIEQAMAQLATGRRGELIEPKPSEDMAPMTGWSKMPKQAPVAPVAAPVAEVQGLGSPHVPGSTIFDHATGHTTEPMTLGDGGAVHAADAAAMREPAMTIDAGARAPRH